MSLRFLPYTCTIILDLKHNLIREHQNSIHIVYLLSSYAVGSKIRFSIETKISISFKCFDNIFALVAPLMENKKLGFEAYSIAKFCFFQVKAYLMFIPISTKSLLNSMFCLSKQCVFLDDCHLKNSLASHLLTLSHNSFGDTIFHSSHDKLC